jgi:hypothetical protein
MKALVAFSLVAAALLGGVVYFEESRISDLKKQIDVHRRNAAEQTGRIARLDSEIENLKRQLNDSKSLTEQLQSRLAKGGEAAGSSTPESAAGAADQKEAGGAKWMKGIAKMFTDPEMRKTMRSQQMMGIRMMYGDLAKELGLSPQDTEQLLELLTERQMDMAAAGMKAFDSKNPDFAKEKDRLAENSKRYEDQIKAVLGEEKFKTLQTYESSMGDRFMLQQFEGQFGAAGAPLEGNQKQQLLSLMQEERAKTPPELNLPNSRNPAKQMEALKNPETVNQYISAQETFQKRVLERSRQFLNADQVGALEKVHQQQLELLRMQLKMSQEMFGGGK